MKRIVNKSKIDRKVLLGIILGIMISTALTCTFVYAVGSVIESKSVLYNRTISGGSSDNVQGSIDELYKMSGVSTIPYKEEILNGADPVLGQDMIPVTLDGDGTVKYANLNTPWYKYEEKRWANAVILKSNPSKSYKTGDIILEDDIESYFVWVPRFKYKLWNLATENGYVDLTKTQIDVASIGNIRGNVRKIDVIFENKDIKPSTTEKVDLYYTHPAFITFDVNGLWVAKFEASGTTSAITVKPNMISLRSTTVGDFWHAFYNYKNTNGNHNTNLDPHMIKNTEWGAVAYLSHSVYGIGNEININNNSAYKTGYSAAANTDQSSVPGTYGTKEVADDDGPAVTQPYNTSTGYLASTTGNIIGIYDMSGGAHEYVAGYLDPYGVASSDGVVSGLTTTDLAKTQYFDKYLGSTVISSYSKRILSDATGEMGQFYYYLDKNGGNRIHNAWYFDGGYFVEPKAPWFSRGGTSIDGILAGQFYFYRDPGNANSAIGSRLVLAVK